MYWCVWGTWGLISSPPPPPPPPPPQAHKNEDNHLNHHNDVIKWKYFPRYLSFVREIHRSPVNSPHKGQWRRALISSLICAWINRWVNNREAGDVRHHRAHYKVIVMRVSTCATFQYVCFLHAQMCPVGLDFGPVTLMWCQWSFFLLRGPRSGLSCSIRLRISC